MFDKKAIAILSTVLGFFFALISYLLLCLILGEEKYNLIVSILGGALFSLALMTYFLIYLKYYAKKYTEFENVIDSPVFYKTNGNFNLSNGQIKNGNIYFCEAGIICVCLDKKPYALAKILVEDIENIEYDTIHLNVTTKDKRYICVTLSDINSVIPVLKEKDWIK